MAKKVSNDPRATTAIDARIGERVRMYRFERAMSQTELADAIGVTFQQIQKYEKGANRISAATLLRICAAMDIEAPTLLDGLQGRKSRVSQSQADMSELTGIASRLNDKGLRLLLSMARTFADDKALSRTRQKP